MGNMSGLIFIGACCGLFLAGCRQLEPAPKELDRLFPWFFSQVDQAEPEQLAEGFRNLYAAADPGSLDGPIDGTLTRLHVDDLGTALVDAPKLDRAAGVYMLRPLRCGMQQLQRVLTHGAQDELYPDAYDTYSRTFTSDASAFSQGETDLITWNVEYSATILGKSYTSTVLGALRRVPVLDAQQSPHGETVVARAYIPEPASFEKDGTSLNQDYQIEMYVPMGEVEILHAYGIWREADFGAGIDSEDEGTQRLLLNNLAKWDEETEALCAQGRP